VESIAKFVVSEIVYDKTLLVAVRSASDANIDGSYNEHKEILAGWCCITISLPK